MTERIARSLATFAIGFALGVVGASTSPAQDSQAAPDTRPATSRQATVRTFESGACEFMVYEPADRTIYLITNVRAKVGDMEIFAQNVILWLAEGADFRKGAATGAESRPKSDFDVVPEDLKKFVTEIYAEGTVIVRQGEELHRCESAFFDLVHDRGIVVDSTTTFPLKTTARDTKLVVHADELRFLSQSRLDAIGVQVTTCRFAHPHYHVASEHMEIFRQHAMAADPTTGTESRPAGIHYDTEGNTLVLGSGMPAIWMPDFAGDTGTPAGSTFRYVKDVRFRSSNRFGRQFGVTLGDDLETETGEKWGSVAVDLEYRSKRGPGAGIDFAYHQPDFRGRTRAYYQRDIGEDKLYGEPPTNNRGWLSFQHRHYLPLELQLDLEANVFSDRGYYPEYFKEEYRGDKPPETYAYLKRSFQNSAVTALFSTRLNHFETVTEYRPKVDYWLVTEPVADLFDTPVYFSTRAEVSQVRRLTDKDLGVAARSTWRADIDNVVEYPFFAGPVKVTPFGGLRETYYSNDLARNNDEFRTGFTYGGEATLIAWKTFDASGGIFGLDGLRHVVEPVIRYQRTTGVDLKPDELVFYDETDTFDNDERLTFEVRNLFQTIRHRPTGPAVDEIFDIDVSMDFFPDADRDNAGDNWGNIVVDTVTRFSDELQIITDFEVDPNTAQLDEFNIAAGYAPNETFQTYAGFRHFEDDWDVVFGQLNWQMTDKWLARIYTSYDVSRGNGIQNELVLARMGHDWVFELILRADYGDNDYSVNFGINPRIFYDPILGPHSVRREPEFQYLGTQIHK